jgi:hypothetical protein
MEREEPVSTPELVSVPESRKGKQTAPEARRGLMYYEMTLTGVCLRKKTSPKEKPANRRMMRMGRAVLFAFGATRPASSSLYSTTMCLANSMHIYV